MGGFCRAIACLGLVASGSHLLRRWGVFEYHHHLDHGNDRSIAVTSPQSISSTTTTAPSSTSTTAEALTVRVTVSPITSSWGPL